MKIINFSPSDSNGGASKAAYRIHREFINNKIESLFYVTSKCTSDDTVKYIKINLLRKLSNIIHRIKNKISPKRSTYNWSFSDYGYVDFRSILPKDNDFIVGLYWNGSPFISIKELDSLFKSNTPIFWRLSDMWSFTGGCHYSFGCKKYIEQCGCCPQLESNEMFDITHKNMMKKINWQNNNLIIICPSKWIYDRAKESRIFGNARSHIVYTGIDLNCFAPTDREAARKKLNLEINKKYILFGAMNATEDKRKGWDHLKNALSKAQDNVDFKDCELLIFGSDKKQESIPLDIKIHYYDHVLDQNKLALIYSAANIFVAPSTEENLANTCIESISCGTAVVAFDIGGMAEIIDHKKSGYLAKPFNEDDLANGILWTINNSNSLRSYSREKALINFCIEKNTKELLKIIDS